MTTHLVIPDVQFRDGDDTEFLSHIGQYIVEKKPTRLICLGDFADMPSLSSYDVGSKSFEGRRYKKDIEAAKQAMQALLEPINNYNNKAKRNHKERYFPTMDLTLGNHEGRISRAVEGDPKLDGTISISDLEYESFGWNVHDFLCPVVLDGVCYSHYFTTGIAGRPASTATAQLNKQHMSCIAGHQQGFQMATAYRADGKRITSMIVGSCYEHNEDYLGPQGNHHWRGIVMLHEVVDGQFDVMPVSLQYLRKRYG